MATLWSEQSFRAYVAGRCKELGIEIRQALAAAGLTHDAYYKTPAASRRVEDVLKIAGALRVSPAQIFGCDLTGDVSLDLLRQAFGTARLMFSRLPGWAQTDENQLEAVAEIYNACALRRREGRPFDAETLANYAEILASRWLTQNQAADAAPDAP